MLVLGQPETTEIWMMNRYIHHRPRIFSLFLITIATFATHWMALFNEGLIAEDSGMFPALLYKDWHALMDMYSSAAVPVFSYFVWPLAFVVNIFLYKAVVILAVYFIAILAYLIALRSGYFSEKEALLVGIFSQQLPIATITTIFTYSTYFNALALFLLATYLFVWMETKRGFQHAFVRGLSLCIYFVAFTFNSLLVLYAGAFLLVYMVRLRIEGQQVRNRSDAVNTFKLFCRSRIDFTLLPIIYWAWKKIFTPKSGLYGSYNAFDLSPKHLVKNSYHFVADGFVLPLAKSIGSIHSYAMLVVAICSVLIVWMFWKFAGSPNQPANNEPVNEQGSWALVGFGFFLLVCGTLPYILVGKSPMSGVLMRNTILMQVPLSVMLVGAWRVLQSRAITVAKTNVATVALLILFVLFTARWWENYAAWQARAAKDIAVAQYLAKNPPWANFSVYWIEDNFPLQGSDADYGFADYTAQFRMLWGGQTRMAFTPGHRDFFDVDSAPGVRPVHTNLPERISFFCNDWSSTRDIDLAGPQAVLDIKPGEGASTNEEIAFKYMYFRFIKPQGLQDYLNGLVTVKLRPL